MSGQGDAAAGGLVTQSAVASGFARVFQAAGDLVVYEGSEPYRLARWPLTAAGARAVAGPSASGVRWPQPSALLRAGNAAVDFVGRTAERDRLERWRDGVEAMAVRLLHGPGGQGKTRLAMQVAVEWRARGWVVLGAFHRRERQAPEAFEVPADLERSAGVLVVVDYAERWDTADLLTLLGDTHVGAGRGIRVRVLLLSRPAGAWWHGLAHRIQEDLGLVADRDELLSLETDPGVSRASLFTAARDRFAALLGVSGAETVGPARELDSRDDYRLVLTVHMAALAAVLGMEDEGTAPGDPVEVSAFLLARERRFWQALHHRAVEPVTATPDAMAQLVYTATLTGPLRHRDGTDVVARIGVESRQAPGQLLKDHARCYPAVVPGGATSGPARPLGVGAAMVLEPLYPDRLGEDFLALLTPGHAYNHPFDPWTDEAPARLLDAGARPEPATEENGPSWTQHALATLIEAADRWEHLAVDQLYPLLRARPELALRAGGAALVALAAHPWVDPDLLEAIADVLPDHHVELDPATAAIATRLAGRRLAANADPAWHARVHAHLAVRLANAGQYDAALVASEEGLRNWRELAAGGGDEQRVTFTRALNNHASWLMRAGRHDAALSVSEEAIETCRDLVHRDHEVHLPELVRALSNHAVWLWAVGRSVEALETSEAALEPRRQLAERDRERHLPHLAVAVANHVVWLTEAKRYPEALTHSQEAVDLARELAAPQRARFLPELVMAVGNHALLMAETGRSAEALSLSGQAVELHRELAALNREAYLPGLAIAVGNHVALLGGAGRPGEALVYSTEELELLRESAELDPDAHLLRLAEALEDHARRLGRAGRQPEAVPVHAEALTLRRELVGRDREAHLPKLAVTAKWYALLLGMVGCPDEALPRVEEAVAAFRELARRDREAYLPGLVCALGDYVRLLAATDRDAAALAYSRQVLDLSRELAARDPDTHLAGFAAAANGHVLRLVEGGRRAEALPCSQEAVDACEELITRDQETHLPLLAEVLVRHGLLVAESGSPVEALAPSERAVAALLELIDHDVDTYMPDLARAAGNHAMLLARIGRHSAALELSEQALSLFAELADRDPSTYLPDVAGAVNNHAVRLAESGQPVKAVALAREAVHLRRQLLLTDQVAHLPGLVQSLTALGDILVHYERYGEAAGPLAEALTGAMELPAGQRDIAASIVSRLRDAYAADPDTVAERFRAVTGREMPRWLRSQ
ncbi:tetratricopeptide repeat protein [Streptomyces sp. NPDC058290]|uniref:tetratricopeptide repeat protein n=1 Tax=Streptomyces sp. NPDC058290 TaxID=3346426 RepID=UPI0036E5B63C